MNELIETIGREMRPILALLVVGTFCLVCLISLIKDK